MSVSAWRGRLLAVTLVLCCAATTQAEDVHILANGSLVFKHSLGPRSCPLPGYCERQLQALPASAYVGAPSDTEMARQKENVTAYLQGGRFQVAVEERAAQGDDRGILVVGGGASLIGMIAVKLRLLRNVHGCTLPVEIAYYGAKELDNVTLATLQENYGPVYGLDLSQLQLPPHQHNFKVTRYTFKVLALQFTRFRNVFFIDADNMPLKDPSHMFESPQFLKYGNLFWPDYWRNGFFLGVSDQAYSVLGLNKTVVQPLFDDGSVLTERAAESGTLLLDRVAHADVLEYVVWINSYDARLKQLIKDGLMGDKDTFKMAFALAGKAHMYMQMPIPPGIGFSVGTQDNLEDKLNHKKELGWAFNGMSQYDHFGDILFFHHTAQKWGSLEEDAVRVDAITGPAAMRWVRYYLAHDNLGPKRFTTAAHSVPFDALQLLDMPPAHLTAFNIDPLNPMAIQELEQECPWHKYLTLARYKSWGLPLAPPDDLITQCKKVDPLVLRTLHHEYGPVMSPFRLHDKHHTKERGGGQQAGEDMIEGAQVPAAEAAGAADPAGAAGEANAAGTAGEATGAPDEAANAATAPATQAGAQRAGGADAGAVAGGSVLHGPLKQHQAGRRGVQGPAKRLRRKRRRQQRSAARRTLQGLLQEEGDLAIHEQQQQEQQQAQGGTGKQQQRHEWSTEQELAPQPLLHALQHEQYELLSMLLQQRQQQHPQQQQQQQQLPNRHLSSSTAVLKRPAVPHDLHRHTLSQFAVQLGQGPLRALQQQEQQAGAAAASANGAGSSISDGGDAGSATAHGTEARGLELPGVATAAGTAGVAGAADAADAAGTAGTAGGASSSDAVRLTPAFDEAHRAGFRRVLDPRYIDRIYWMSDGQELRDGTPLPALRINVPIAQGGDPRLVTLDMMQQVYVPEALTWLRSNYEQLPLLKPKKS